MYCQAAPAQPAPAFPGAGPAPLSPIFDFFQEKNGELNPRVENQKFPKPAEPLPHKSRWRKAPRQVPPAFLPSRDAAASRLGNNAGGTWRRALGQRLL